MKRIEEVFFLIENEFTCSPLEENPVKLKILEMAGGVT